MLPRMAAASDNQTVAGTENFLHFFFCNAICRKHLRGATAQAGFDNPERPAKIASVAIWIFAIVIAVNQIGISATLVNTLLTGLVGAVALAAEIVKKWYEQSQAAAPKIEAAASKAADSARTDSRRGI